MASTPALEAWATFVGGECSNHYSHHGDTLAPWIDVCTHEETIKSKRCWVHLFSFSLYDGVDPSTWFSFLLRNCLCSMACFTMLGRLMPGSCLVFLENCRCVYMRRPAGPLAEIFLQATTILANGAAGLLIQHSNNFIRKQGMSPASPFHLISLFRFRCDENAKIGDKMIYASSKDTIKCPSLVYHWNSKQTIRVIWITKL